MEISQITFSFPFLPRVVLPGVLQLRRDPPCLARSVLGVMCFAPTELPVHFFVRLTVSFSFAPIRHVLTLLPHIIHAITHRVMILDAHLTFTVDTSMITHKMTRSILYFSEFPPLHFSHHATSAALSYPHLRLG
jgi:hypothetical protein